jgi:type IV fimbrial biogenesis protein FimT
MRPHLNRGFTLIELMIAVSIFMLLLMLAGPMYAEYIASSKIRAAAESIVSGVRFAQTQAIRNNTPAHFELDPAKGWEVWALDPETVDRKLRGQAFAEGSLDVDIKPAGGLDSVTFNGLGRIVPQNADASAPLAQVDLTHKVVGGARALRIVVGAGGVRMCEPAVSDVTDARICP